MDINGPAPPPETTPLAQFASANNLPLIIGSDTNSHHTLWGNRACNERGEELLDFLSSLGLSWANKGSTPTFLNSRGHNSCIDLTITNQTGEDLISNWHVSDLFSNSDHRYIMFDITAGPKKEPKTIRLVKNTDWDKFNTILNDSNINNYDLSSTSKIDEAVESINSILQKAFEDACPPTYISSSVRRPPWLTPEVEKAQRSIRRKLMGARNNKTSRAWQALRDSNKVYNKLVSKSRQQAWRKFCKETESIKESARMNNILKSSNDCKTKLQAVYDQNGILTSCPEETLEVMTQTHFKDCAHDLRAPPCTVTSPPTPLHRRFIARSDFNRRSIHLTPLKPQARTPYAPLLSKRRGHTSKTQ